MSSSKIILAFIAGAATGATVALFLSTEKGSELGKKFGDKAKSFADIILTKAEEFLDDAEDAASKARAENK